MKTVVILLAWKRINGLQKTLQLLNNQTNKDFDIHVSNGNLPMSADVDRIVDKMNNHLGLKVKVTHDGNDYGPFRRFHVARDYAQNGYDRAIFIDDDVKFPTDLVQRLQDAYEDKTFGSVYTWSFQDGGSDYYGKRTRVFSNDANIKYAGTGVSIVDTSLFKNKKFFNPPETAYNIDDLWLCYYADHVLKWKLKYIDHSNIVIGGGDSVALYVRLKRSRVANKAVFLRLLVSMGWKV